MKILNSFGFFLYRKAESIAFIEEKSAALTIGTNLGFQNAILIITDDNDSVIDAKDGSNRN